MKMLAFLGGELTNSATYFSTFANISTEDMCDVTKTFGTEPHNNFRPSGYNQRLSLAKKVVDFKGKLEKQKLAAQTKRSKVTSFIT